MRTRRQPGDRAGARISSPNRLALLELRMWKAYYRRQPARLFGLLVMALREQAGVSWPRAIYAAGLLTRAAVGFARSTGDYERFAPDVARGYGALGLPDPSTSEPSLTRSSAGGSSGARSDWPPAPRPASRSPGCTRRCTTCRSNRSAKPAACAGWLPRSAIAARPQIRTVPGARVRPTGRRWPACSGPRTAA